jgi:ketosteroid isomerase-like protein
MAFDGDAFVRRFIGLWDAHDVDGIVEMFTDDVLFEASIGPEAWGDRATGREASRTLVEAFFRRMPDAHYQLLRHFASPEFAAVESRTTGTYAGAPYDVHLVDLLTLRDGRIGAKRSYRKVRT